MHELTNTQRNCFALLPVDPNWERIALKPSPYDRHTTVAYLDGTLLRKVILIGEDLYCEYEVFEELSADRKYLLPKTPKGKPVLLSAATLTKRTMLGMSLSWSRNNGHTYIDLYNRSSQKGYYSYDYEDTRSCAENEFDVWVARWCAETSDDDRIELARFAAEPRQHVRFREGDIFRFRINRRLYGYGRILLDYALMRKQKIPFWDILMGKPLACSVYHIVTERTDVTVEELRGLRSLPSVHIMDNKLFYGEFEIIGNIPIGDYEDYPIMYGNSNDARYRAVLLQWGRLYRRDDNGTALFRSISHHGISFHLRFKLDVLLSCIAAGSNEPYWIQTDRQLFSQDLRNPKYRAELEQVCRQFELDPSALIR